MSRVYMFVGVFAVLLVGMSGCVPSETSDRPSLPVATASVFVPSPTWQPEPLTQSGESTEITPTSQARGIRQIKDNTLNLREYWRELHTSCPAMAVVAGRVACLLPDDAHQNLNLRVYDAASGDLMWEKIPATFPGGGGAEVVADEERVYTLYIGRIHAYDLNSGQELWDKWTFPDKVVALYPDGDKLYASMSLGDAVSCTLDALTGDDLGCGSLLASDGFQRIAQYPQFELYIRQSQYPSTDTMKLRAVDGITQQVLWSIDSGLLVGGPLMLVDNVLLIDARRLLAIDAQSGQILWRSRDFAWGTTGLAANAVVVGRSVYAMGYNARLSQVDPRTGQETGYIQFMPATLPEEYGGACSMATDGQMLFITFGDTEELIALGP